MELYKIAIRALFAYLFILAMLRLSGKRTIAQGTNLDFIVALIVGDMLDDLFWADVSASKLVVGAGFVMLAHVTVSMACYKSKAAARLIEGSPAMIMRGAVLLRSVMRRERVNEKEVEEFLRAKGLDSEDWNQVKSAHLNKEGKAAIVKQEWARPAQKKEIDRLRKAIE